MCKTKDCGCKEDIKKAIYLIQQYIDYGSKEMEIIRDVLDSLKCEDYS